MVKKVTYFGAKIVWSKRNVLRLVSMLGLKKLVYLFLKPRWQFQDSIEEVRGWNINLQWIAILPKVVLQRYQTIVLFFNTVQNGLRL